MDKRKEDREELDFYRAGGFWICGGGAVGGTGGLATTVEGTLLDCLAAIGSP